MQKLVNETKQMNTIDSLVEDFRNIGLKEGMTVLVHSSLSSMGWTNGGAKSVIDALIQVLTEEGTIVMPTQSADLSDPSEWEAPSVPELWWPSIRQTMPAYDPNTTPTMGMGTIVDVFRTYPNVKRSAHPAVSFAAWGKHKDEIIDDHALDFGLGEHSPLARLYELEASVLLIGTTFETNTAFHLGEYRVESPKIIKKAAPIMEQGQRKWVEYDEIEFQEELFPEIGYLLQENTPLINKKIGQADSYLFAFRDAVDTSAHYFNQKR
ncbi:aminoglycoside 3-N-acetyltransferase [Pelagirhabdus alkalitolerans]|uniref:Aminoglycoside N(3)-acetyltransferase n=1 Tax=Pelagirhabdus alkalitolerans TaxID=1612202 RepID=A0A1G6GJA7_9BACI|nr:AAC(3) family N-acetyltransferase [Pelagirhabdus alkalitolerans]SDB81923.1 aminoglycoside 3-N-acetyltransferase [Pelagirhabdus alkalitolerans]